MSELTFKCKYCRANTTHKRMGPTERNTVKGEVYKCIICGYSKFLYRKGSRLLLDQSKVPERRITMPHDLDVIQNEIVSEEQEKANKEIDEWLRNPNWFPVRKGGKGR